MAATSIIGLKRNDPRAQKEFWDAYLGRLSRLCKKALANDVLGEEVAVDTLADFVFKYVHRLECDDAAWAYLKLMAMRRVAAVRQSLEKRGDTGLEAFLDQRCVGRNQEDELFYRALQPQLLECLEKLSPKARQALTMRFTNDETTERIGFFLGGSKQYIGRLLRQSYDKLRRCLEHGLIRAATQRQKARGTDR